MFWTISLGIVTGMRTMTVMAVLCWAAYLGYLPVAGTWASWTAKLATVVVFTVFALGEYVGDTLPRTPSRTDPPLLAARLIFGSMVCVIAATALGQPVAGGVLLGVIGALIGTYGGHWVRMRLARRVGRDLPVALAESAVALGVAMYAVQEIVIEIVRYAHPSVLHVMQ